jgi:hypothetical protein
LLENVCFQSLKQPVHTETYLCQLIPVSKVAQNEKYRLPKIVINEVASSEQVFAKDSDLVLLGLVKFDGEAVSHGCVSAYREVWFVNTRNSNQLRIKRVNKNSGSFIAIYTCKYLATHFSISRNTTV